MDGWVDMIGAMTYGIRQSLILRHFVVISEFPGNVNPVTKEKDGPRGPEPTRYGDWERKGRCVDF